MAVREIKSRISLDGTSKFNAELKKVDSNLRLLKAELNAVTTSFDKENATMQDLLKVHSALSKQISQQTVKVDALKGAISDCEKLEDEARKTLEETIATYGENSEAADKARRNLENLQETTKGYKTKLANAETQLNRTVSSMNQNRKAMSNLTSTGKIFSSSLQQVGNSAEGISNDLTETSNVTSKLKKSLESAKSVGITFSKISFVAVSATVKGLHTAFKTLLPVIHTSTKALVNMTSSTIQAGLKAINTIVETSIDGFEKYAKTISNITTKLAESSVSTGMDFSSQMSNVQALMGYVDNTNEQLKEMNALEERAKKIGASTKFTATEVGQAYENMAKAGWKSSDMLNAINDTMSLSSASGEELATVTKVLTNSMMSLGYEVTEENTSKFADTLAITVTNANTNIEELGEALKYIGSTGKTLGYTIEDLSVGLGLMANQGIVGEQAGNALKSGLQRLVNPTEKAYATMNKLGISLTNAEGKTASFDEVLIGLKKAFRTLSVDLKDSEGNFKDYDTLLEEVSGSTKELQMLQDAGTIFGKQQVSNWLALIQSEESDYNKLTNAIENADGMAEKMSKIQLDNLTGDVTILTSAFEGVGLSISKSVETPLRDLVQSATDFLSNINNSLQNRIDFSGIQQSIQGFSNSLNEQINAIDDDVLVTVDGITATFNTTLLEGLKIGINSAPELIGQGLQIIINGYWDLINGLIDNVTESSPELISVAENVILSFTTGLTSASKNIKKSLPTVTKNISSSIKKIIPSILEMGGSIIDTLISGILMALPEIMSIGNDILEQFNNSFDNAPEYIGNIIDNLHDTFVINFTQLLDGVVSLFGNLFDTLTTEENTIKITGFVRMVVDDLANAFNDLLPQLVDFLPTILDDILQPILNTLVNSDVLQTLATGLIELITSAIVWISKNIEKVADLVVNLFTTISDTLTENQDVILPAIAEFVSGLLIGLSKNIDTLLESLLELIGELVLTLTSPDVLEPLLDGVTTLVTDVLYALVENIPTLIDAIMQVAKAIVQIITEPENFSALMETIFELLSDICLTLPTILIDVLAGLGYIVGDIVSAVKDWITTGNWKEIGKEIMGGIVGGIEDAWESASKAVTDVGNRIVNRFKEIFDINSPSKLMNEEIGKPIIQGVGAGVTDNLKQVENDINKSVQDMTNNITINRNADFANIKFADDIVRRSETEIKMSVNKNNGSDTYNHNFNGLFNGATFIINNDADYNTIAEKIQETIQREELGVGIT